MTRPQGLAAAALVLMAGGAAAQVLPLLLGPWLARLYAPAQWGAWALFAAVTANLAVIACARYDFALPLARDDDEAAALMALCLRIGLAVVALVTVGTGVALVMASAIGRPLPGGLALWAWLPAAVAATALLQAMALWAGRAQRFGPLAVSRVVQHGGGAVGQGLIGALAAPGSVGLAAGSVIAAAVAVVGLHRPPPSGGWRALRQVPAARWRAAAARHRDFPWLNTPHAFLGTLQDAVAIALIVGITGDVAAGWWALALRYLKAPATLVGGALSQALYPKLAAAGPADGLRLLRRTVAALVAGGFVLAVALAVAGPAAFRWAFGDAWAPAGDLARALALYVAAHFVASPLGVVTLAWRAQAWALKVAIAGQVLFVGALGGGLLVGGPTVAAWAVSAVMGVYYVGYAAFLASGRLRPADAQPGDNGGGSGPLAQAGGVGPADRAERPPASEPHRTVPPHRPPPCRSDCDLR